MSGSVSDTSSARWYRTPSPGGNPTPPSAFWRPKVLRKGIPKAGGQGGRRPALCYPPRCSPPRGRCRCFTPGVRPCRLGAALEVPQRWILQNDSVPLVVGALPPPAAAPTALTSRHIHRKSATMTIRGLPWWTHRGTDESRSVLSLFRFLDSREAGLAFTLVRLASPGRPQAD